MSDTTDEMEGYAGQYENYLEEQEELENLREMGIAERKMIKQIIREEIPKEAYLPKGCDCANGIHDGKRIDCNCRLCH